MAHVRWQAPRPSGGFVWPLWRCAAENAYFKLFKHATPALVNEPFQIVLKGKDYVVAVSKDEAAIDGVWKGAIADLVVRMKELPTLQAAQYALDKVQGLLVNQTRPHSADMDASLNSADDWVLCDDNAGAEEETAIDEATMKRLFNLEHERVVAQYGCSLWSATVPLVGRLYVSPHFLCFASAVGGMKTIIRFREVTRITLEDYRGVPGAVRVASLGGVHYIAMLFGIKECHTLLVELWKDAMHTLEKTADFAKRENAKSKFKEDVDLSVEADEKAGRIQAQSTKEALAEICALFRLPATELIFVEYACTLDLVYPGTLYVLSHFLAFRSRAKSILISTLKKGLSAVNDEYSNFRVLGVLPAIIEVHVTSSVLHFAVVNRKRVFRHLAEHIAHARSESLRSSLPNALTMFVPQSYPDFDISHLADPSQFSPGYAMREHKQTGALQVYAATYGSGVTIQHTPALLAIVRGGVPLGLKGAVWTLTGGAAHHALVHPTTYYAELVRTMHEKSLAPETASATDRTVLEQIERDLHRSLPQESLYQTERGISALRRVLRAFAAHNEDIGYCQSMNIIVATLLLFVDEEAAFYILCALIERVPEYYTTSMSGAVVDVRVLEHLLRDKDDELVSHITSKGVELSVLVLPWILCSFVGYVPWEVALRVLDDYIAEGPTVLLQTAMAALVSHRAALLACDDVVSLTEAMKEAAFDPDELCTLAFEKMALDRDTVAELRHFYTFQHLQEVQQRNAALICRDLTIVSVPELKKLRADFESCLSVDSPDGCLRFDQFAQLCARHMPQIPASLLPRLRSILDESQNGVISFSEFVRGLDALTGPEGLRLALVFRIFASEEDHVLARVDVAAAVDTALVVLDPISREREKDGFAVVGEGGEDDGGVHAGVQEAVEIVLANDNEKESFNSDAFAALVVEVQRLMVSWEDTPTETEAQ